MVLQKNYCKESVSHMGLTSPWSIEPLPCSEVMIGRGRSRDLNTGLWLVETGHVMKQAGSAQDRQTVRRRCVLVFYFCFLCVVLFRYIECKSTWVLFSAHVYCTHVLYSCTLWWWHMSSHVWSSVTSLSTAQGGHHKTIKKEAKEKENWNIFLALTGSQE